MSSAGSVGGDATLRLFLALQLPGEVREALGCWAAEQCVREHPDPDGRGATRDAPDEHRATRLVRSIDLHVTLAFLGARPSGEVAAILDTLRAAVGGSGPIALTPLRWRETRSVGMVVLGDEGDAAGTLARDLHARLEALGVYRAERRPWLAHVTVARWREPPRLSPSLPPMGTFVPSGAAAYISRLHPSGALYEVLESVELGQVELGQTEKPVGGTQ